MLSYKGGKKTFAQNHTAGTHPGFDSARDRSLQLGPGAETLTRTELPRPMPRTCSDIQGQGQGFGQVTKAKAEDLIG